MKITMKKSLKLLAIISILSIAAALMIAGLKMLQGNYFQNASFITSAFVLIVFVLSILFITWVIRRIWVLACCILVVAYGCNYAKSNQQVVISTDCGMTWKKINAGDAVPKGTMNPCYMKVVIPNYPMQGDSRFISNFKDRVRAAVHIDYDYSIIEPLAFIKQAKYLGKANIDADDDGALDPGAFEGAENMVIDKRIRDVSKGILLNEDIVELDQADLEQHLYSESNKVLEPFGVKLNFITLTFDLDEQTRQAIDVSTAMKIYESKQLQDIGKQVMSQRAGASKIIIEQPKTQQP